MNLRPGAIQVLVLAVLGTMAVLYGGAQCADGHWLRGLLSLVVGFALIIRLNIVKLANGWDDR